MFSIDGLSWPWPCDIERVAEMKPSDISGMLLDKSWFNDVLGTYLRYTVKIAVPLDHRDDYSAIYESITAPVDGHSFVLPYNQGTVTVTGRVENVADVYVEFPNGGMYWKGIQFEVIANHPTKTMSLGEVLTRGRAPIPEVASPTIGDLYMYTEDGWQYTVYDDADAKYY